MQEIAEDIRRWVGEGRRSVVARVVDIQGFSTWPGDSLVVVDDAGESRGSLLGPPGQRQVRDAALAYLDARSAGEDRPGAVSVSIQGSDVVEAGLSCGGQADVILQLASGLPPVLWDLLADRTPTVLLTWTERPDTAAVVAGDGRIWSALDIDEEVLAVARRALSSGQTLTRRLDHAGEPILVEVWVPSPRLVVVGAGDLVDAIDRQSALLGWASRAMGRPDELDGRLEWAGGTAALIMLSHDPDVDVPVLEAALAADVAYIGAMGSRRTQARRMERLSANGVPAERLEHIHRPIGLDLGGRGAAEVALSICAEILAVRCGRDGGHLQGRTGPINDRPAAIVRA